VVLALPICGAGLTSVVLVGFFVVIGIMAAKVR